MFETEDEKKEINAQKEKVAREKALAKQKVQETEFKVLAHNMGVKIDDNDIFRSWMKKQKNELIMPFMMGLFGGFIIGAVIAAILHLVI